MKRAALAGLLSTLALGSAARAEEPFTAGKPSVSGHLGYGAYMGEGTGNPYGFLLGARGGYTLDSKVYFGGVADYFFGSSETAAGNEVSVGVWLLQGEVGYDIGLTPTVMIRPKMGLGLTTGHAKVCVGGQCESDSQTKFSLAPGAELPIDLGGFYIAPELRFNLVFTGDAEGNGNGFILAVGGGAAF